MQFEREELNIPLSNLFLFVSIFRSWDTIVQKYVQGKVISIDDNEVFSEFFFFCDIK